MGFLGDLLIKEATRELTKEYRKEIRTVLRALKDRAVDKGKEVYDKLKHEKNWQNEVVAGDPDMQALKKMEEDEERALRRVRLDVSEKTENTSPVKEPTEEPTEEPVKEPTEEPTKNPAEKPTAKD